MHKAQLPIYWPVSDRLLEEDARVFEDKADEYWDRFYRSHGTGFFKDRHYLHRELPMLAEGRLTILEVGCGVGNTALPLAEINPQAFVYACDFSPAAIECLRASQAPERDRVKAFVADVTRDDLQDNISPASVDVCTMVFVLSAISPTKMHNAITNVSRVLKAGGTVYVRDYATGDMAEGRFNDSLRVKQIAERFFVRADGTRAYYFDEDELRSIFGEAGFRCSYTRIFERCIENRALSVSMDRRWVQGVFTFAGKAESNDISAAVNGGMHTLPHRDAISDARAQGEWETGGQPAVGENGMQQLFTSSEAGDLEEEAYDIEGAGSFVVSSLSRVHKNTVAHTGLMLWDAGPALANFLANSGTLLNGRVILELGCGSSPLCLLAALRHARRVVSTDGSLEALKQMARNISLNSSKVVVERARLRHLVWGDHSRAQRLLLETPSGFDIIIGADVVYAAESVPQMFQTADWLLSRQPEAHLFLCHVTRRVSEDKIIAHALAAGFVQTALPTGYAQERSCQTGALRLLVFCRKAHAKA